MRGIVKNVILDKGYGFIAVSGAADAFFHRTGLEGLDFDEQLNGRRVEFELIEDQKTGRERAMRVRATN